MTSRQALNRARELLANHKIEDASLEAELLLRHTLKIDRTQFYTEPDRMLTKQQEETYWQFVERRIKGEPSAYIPVIVNSLGWISTLTRMLSSLAPKLNYW
jgi:release factor glutamine methyltransferase